MSTTKHTAGPWRVRPFDLDDETNPVRESTLNGETWQFREWAVLGAATERSVCIVGWRADTGSWGPIQNPEEAVANRHLIAAAPDLLAALEDALEQLEAYSGVVAHAYSDRPDLCTTYLDVTEAAASIIYKAKGGC